MAEDWDITSKNPYHDDDDNANIKASPTNHSNKLVEITDKIQEIQEIREMTAVFSCHVCQALFTTEAQLILHEGEHNGGKTPPMADAWETSLVIINPDNKDTHEGEAHLATSEEKLSPTNFHDQFVEIGDAGTHENAEISSVFICNVCQALFTTEAQLILHESEHNGGKTPPCNRCGKPYDSMARLLLHMASCDGTSFKDTICKQCGKSSTHLRHQCYKCKKYRYKKKYFCPLCPAVFEFSKALTDHGKVHGGLPRQYECYYCPASYAHIGSRYYHERQHILNHGKVSTNW